MNKPKNDPQTYAEMYAVQQQKRSTITYRQESSEYVDAELSELVKLATEELAEATDALKTTPLKDTGAVEAKAVAYLRACQETSTIPMLGGFYRSLGYSFEAVRKWINLHPEHPTTDFLQMFRDMTADVLSQAALRNYLNPVYSIFYQKARNNLKDVISIEAVPSSQPLGEMQAPEDIAEKYQLLEEYEGENDI